MHGSLKSDFALLAGKDRKQIPAAGRLHVQPKPGKKNNIYVRDSNYVITMEGAHSVSSFLALFPQTGSV